MNKYRQKIILSFDGEDSCKIVIVKQYDSARILDILILIDHERVILPEGTRATFRALKPDGNSVMLNTEVNPNGTISVELTEQTLAVAGNVRADVALISQDGSVISTCAFNLLVRPAPVGKDLKSTNEWQELMDATGDCNQLVADLQAAWNLGELDGVSPTVEIKPIMGGNRVIITDRNGPHTFDVFNGDGSGTFFTPGNGLKMTMTEDGNVLAVDAADDAEQDNTKPITSAAVYREIGNIDAILQTI